MSTVVPAHPGRTRAHRAGRSARALLVAASLAGIAASIAGCETVPFSDVGPALEDQAPLSANVRQALADDPQTVNAPIMVMTLGGGQVRLSGIVNAELVRRRAEQIANAVPGVTDVVNTIQLRDD